MVHTHTVKPGPFKAGFIRFSFLFSLRALRVLRGETTSLTFLCGEHARYRYRCAMVLSSGVICCQIRFLFSCAHWLLGSAASAELTQR